MKTIELVVKENEEKILPFVWINDQESEYSVNVRLVGSGAQLQIVGLFLGTNANNVVFNTTVIHEAPNTFSRTTLRGVFKNRAVFSNDGLVRINNGAKNADGYFTSKILLFDDAKGRSVPSLEIDENELKAGHASTVGRPDENQLFYLRSRGLSEDEAIKLMVAGFFEPVANLLPLAEKNLFVKSIKKYL